MQSMLEFWFLRGQNREAAGRTEKAERLGERRTTLSLLTSFPSLLGFHHSGTEQHERKLRTVTLNNDVIAQDTRCRAVCSEIGRGSRLSEFAFFIIFILQAEMAGTKLQNSTTS